MSLDIKQRLRDRGVTQKEVAARLGVSEPTISQWGAALRSGDHRRVPSEQAKPLAAAIGVHPSAIRPDLFDPPAAPAKQEAA